MGKGIAVVVLLAIGSAVALVETQTSGRARADSTILASATTHTATPPPPGTAAQTTLVSPATPAVSSTTPAGIARSASPRAEPVETVTGRDIEMLAHDSYFRWFDSIYRDDREALAAAVGTREMYEAGITAMEDDSIAFTDAPTLDNVILTVDEVLLARPDCVVVLVTDDLSRVIDVRVASRTVIDVYWPDAISGSFRMAAQWGAGSPTSMWRVDCDQRIRGFTP